VHITSSVGWVGAILTYLTINIIALTSSDAPTVRGAYLLMEPLVRYAIIPMAVTSLITGVVMALVTRWGLLKHRWVATSLWLTLVAVGVLIGHIGEVSELTAHAAAPVTDGPARADLPHTIGGLLVVSVPLVLNIYKLRGLTRRGRRLQAAAATPTASPAEHDIDEQPAAT
jgi:uncharacterized membrane protein